jgi:hypothetical protein
MLKSMMISSFLREEVLLNILDFYGRINPLGHLGGVGQQGPELL